MSYWAELQVWGLHPVAFHATNALVIAACAALLVVAVHRYTGDAAWAMGAGILFAIHPYHVENAAWIAARTDSAATLLALVSLLAYERWSRNQRGLALWAIVAFEAALLFKESVVFFPAMVIILRSVPAERKITSREWLRGILPLGGTALFHFVVLRRLCLGDAGLSSLRTFGVTWVKRGADFFSAAILPVHAEQIEAHAVLALIASLAVLGLLVVLARVHLSGRRREVAAVILLFGASVVPSLLSFQERYLFFPSAISAAALAFLLLRVPRRTAPFLWAMVSVIWVVSLTQHWVYWREAGKASTQLIRGLTEASRLEGVAEIVIANQPYRVGGAPVNGDLNAAVRLSGGGPVQVRAATSLDLPTASASGIEGRYEDAVRLSPNGVEVKVRMPHDRFSGVFLPLQRPPNTTKELGFATLEFDDRDGVTVRIPRNEDGSRVAYVWYDGALTRLF